MTSVIAPVPGPESILADAAASPSDGIVRWAPLKSLWIGGMTLAALALGPAFCRADAVLLFLVTSAITLCFGHSVGMHRRLIHRSFDCPLHLEPVLYWLPLARWVVHENNARVLAHLRRQAEHDDASP